MPSSDTSIVKYRNSVRGCPLACYFCMTSSPSQTSHLTRTPTPADTPSTSLCIPILARTPSAGLWPQHLPCTTRTEAFKCGFALGLWILDPNSAGAQVSSWKLEVREPANYLDPNSQTSYPLTSLATRHSGLVLKDLQNNNETSCNTKTQRDARKHTYKHSKQPQKSCQ